jgi:tetratricopeptide (TPR) repeat protein
VANNDKDKEQSSNRHRSIAGEVSSKKVKKEIKSDLTVVLLLKKIMTCQRKSPSPYPTRSGSGSFTSSVLLLLFLVPRSCSLMPSFRIRYNWADSTSHLYPLSIQSEASILCMVMMAMPEKDIDSWSGTKQTSVDNFQKQDKQRRVRQKYQRKRIPETERDVRELRRERQAKYEAILKNSADGACPNVWSFEGLFPQAVWDEETIKKDLYEIKRRDAILSRNKQPKLVSKMKTSAIGGSSMMRVWRDPKLSSYILPYDPPPQAASSKKAEAKLFDAPTASEIQETETVLEPPAVFTESVLEPLFSTESVLEPFIARTNNATSLTERFGEAAVNRTVKVDFQLTRMVEDRMYGYQRGPSTYASSLMGDGAVKFREGVRLGNPLGVNADRLNYLAKKELRKDRVEEAQELYEMAIEIDPRDGRAYLGLSRCVERRRDYKLARDILRAGIANSVSCDENGVPDRGANPFVMQALGCLEEKSGHLAQAEALYIEAARSRPSHAAAWVALGQLRTNKFRQGAAAGRVCYQTAERELQRAGRPASAHVYTAWASLEYKRAGDVRQARKLFKSALKVDPKCSAAWLQLGVMEGNNENWKEAHECFEAVLQFDQRNSRVMQAYAIMESKRPDANSRKAIGLFERALKANPRDAGVLQPYALYVASLGDIDAAREL